MFLRKNGTKRLGITTTLHRVPAPQFSCYIWYHHSGPTLMQHLSICSSHTPFSDMNGILIYSSSFLNDKHCLRFQGTNFHYVHPPPGTIQCWFCWPAWIMSVMSCILDVFASTVLPWVILKTECRLYIIPVSDFLCKSIYSVQLDLPFLCILSWAEQRICSRALVNHAMAHMVKLQ